MKNYISEFLEKLPYIFLLMASSIVAFYLLSENTFSIKRIYAFSEVFFNMWGHLTKLDPTIDQYYTQDETFLIDGKAYTYYLPFPALIRGLFSLINLGQFPIPSTLLGCIIFITVTYKLLNVIGQALGINSSNSSKTGIYLFALFTLGSPIYYFCSYPMTYWESIIWAITLYLIAVYTSIILLKKMHKTLLAYLFALICGLCLFTRATEILASLFLFLFTIFIHFSKIKNCPKYKISVITVYIVFVLALLLLNYAKWGNPFEFAPLQHYTLMWSQEDYQKFITHKSFNISRFFENFSYYLLPKPENYTLNFPFIKPTETNYFAGMAHFDYQEKSLPLSVGLPVWTAFFVGGIVTIFHKRLWKNIELLPSLLASLIPILLIFFFYSQAIRYGAEFIPAFIIYSCTFINLNLINNDKSRAATILCAMVISSFFSISSANIQLAINQQWAKTLPPPLPDANKKILFSNSGNGARYLIGIGAYEVMGWGWSYPEIWGTWGLGSQSEIKIPLPNPRPRFLDIELTTPNKLKSKEFDMYLNENFARKIVLRPSQPETIRIKIPEIDFNLPKNTYNISIKFIPTVLDPIYIEQMLTDQRALSLGIISAEFYK